MRQLAIALQAWSVVNERASGRVEEDEEVEDEEEEENKEKEREFKGVAVMYPFCLSTSLRPTTCQMIPPHSPFSEYKQRAGYVKSERGRERERELF